MLIISPIFPEQRNWWWDSWQNCQSQFGRLRANVWEWNGIILDAHLKVYKAVVLPTLLYTCEAWTVYQLHGKILNHFHFSCGRQLLKSKWLQTRSIHVIHPRRQLGRFYLRSPYLIIISAICHCHSFKNELVLELNTAWRKQPIADYVSNHNRTCGESVSENSE